MNRKIKNIINITAFLVCIGLINIAGQNIEIEIRGMNAFTFILIVAVLLQIIFFIPSFLLKTEKYYDLVGSLTYIATVSLAYFSVENKNLWISNYDIIVRRIGCTIERINLFCEQ